MKWLASILLGLAGPIAAQTCQGSWRAFAPGDFNGRVHALVRYGTGSGARLFATGEFTRAGGNPARHLAVYDGASWSEYKAGLDGPGFALEVFGNRLYVGGTFNHAGQTAVANIASTSLLSSGSGWDDLSGGCNGRVLTIQVVFGELLVGGEFGRAGSLAVTNLAAYNGVWMTRGPSGLGTVTAITTVTYGLTQLLWVGGAGPAGGFVKEFTGTVWRDIGAGLPPVADLDGPYLVSAYSDTVLYWNLYRWVPAGTVDTGGHSILTHAGARYVGSWNGLFRLDAGGATRIGQINGDVRSLCSSGQSLWLGGMFTSIGSGEATCVAEYRSGIVHAVGNDSAGTGAYRNVSAVHAADLDGDGADELYVAGLFQHVGPTRGVQIARWNGVRWSPLGEGLRIETFPSAMLAWRGSLYVAGQIDGTPGVPANNIAAWDGRSWRALGAGLPQPAAALCIHDDGSGPALYAGGFFGVSRWNGSAWQNLAGLPIGGVVKSLQSYAGSLYAGGEFPAIGTTLARNLAQWDGSTWAEVGGGVQTSGGWSSVNTLAVYRGSLFVGGVFDQVGSRAYHNLARWYDAGLSSGWSSVGGVDGWVTAMDVVQGDLYVGGAFGQAGSTAASSIARWTGMQWTPLAGGLTGIVSGIAGFDPDGHGPAPLQVIAGGLFDQVDGMPTGNLASWEPLPPSWTDLGGGIPGTPWTLPAISFLDGMGVLSPNSLARVSLSRAAQNTNGSLVIALQSTPLPWFGGTWYPNPGDLYLPFQTDQQGMWQLTFSMPALPCGTDLWLQAIFVDSGVPRGFAFSNGLRATAR